MQEVNALFIIIILLDFLILGSSRIGTCIHAVAVQGALLGVISLFGTADSPNVHTGLIVIGMIGLKGMLIPRMLFRAIRQAKVHREIEPHVGFTASLLLGIILVGFSFWLSAKLPLPITALSSLLVPTAFATVMIGLLLIVSRTKAVTQVVGYLVLENGIFLFGLTLTQGLPLLVEIGILLDVFVAVFIMGIAIYHINYAFDSLDAHKMTSLRG